MKLNKKIIIYSLIISGSISTQQAYAGALQSSLVGPHKIASAALSLKNIKKKKLVAAIMVAVTAVYVGKNKEKIKEKVIEKITKMTIKALKKKLIETGRANLTLAAESFSKDLLKNMSEVGEL